MIRTTSIALVTIITALGGASAIDSASAEFPASADEQRNQFVRAPSANRSGNPLINEVINPIDRLNPASRPKQSLPSATSRQRIEPPHNPVPQPPALNRDMRGTPSMGGRGGVRGLSGGRMNGGMGRR
jgi:hypothetical protein